MSELVLETLVSEQDAGRALRAKAADITIHSARLRHHPFAGFRFHVPQPGGGGKQAHVLVDYYSGKAFLSDPWRTIAAADAKLDAVADPQWNTIDFQTARERAESLVRTAAMRRARLAWRGGTREVHSVETVWKPNWLVSSSIAGRDYRIMVDGLNGGYFVIGG